MFPKRVRLKSRKLRKRELKNPERRVIFGKKVKIGFYGLIAGAILFGIYRFLNSNLFTPLLVNVSIHQCGEYACLVEGDVKAEVEEKFGGKNLIFTDFGELVKHLKDQSLVIAEVHFDRFFLSRKLEVEVVGRKALVVVFSSRHSEGSESDEEDEESLSSSETSSEILPLRLAPLAQGQDDKQATQSASRGVADYGDLYFVDEEGMAFAKTENTFGLPVVPLPKGKTIEVGEKIEGDHINTYLEILGFLDKNKITIQNLEAGSENQVVLYVFQGPEVALSTQKNIEEQVSLLAVILQRYRVEGEKLKRVDLRFEKPVVEY